ncbi:MAG: TonB-dependent receptor [Prevotella sp.]|nr:TonB-dependent receptor [Prevotella sp.]
MQKRFFFLMVMLLTMSLTAMAQITTSSMAGKVTEQSTSDAIIGATIIAVHEPSGTRYTAISNTNGRFSIQGMRPGGPYAVTISFIGLQTKTLRNINLLLGETYNLDAWLDEDNNTLAEVVVSGKASKFAGEKTGASTNINNAMIRELPSISRSITDITRVSPYANGMSFTGANARMSNFTLDGANMNNNFGLTSSLPGGGTPVSMDAIEEVQVVVAPYDVRQSNFIGGGINAVTKSGTNQFKGTAYVYHFNENMHGNRVDNQELADRTKERKTTYGFTLGGPIVKNKLFFFANMERADVPSTVNRWQGSTDGVAQPKDFISRTKLSDLQRVSEFVKQQYGYDTGSWTDFPADEKNMKYLARLDWNITDRHHLNVRFNYTENEVWNTPSAVSNDFGTSWNISTEANFSQTSMGYANDLYTMNNKVTTWSANLNSRFTDKFNNELLFTYSDIDDVRDSNSSPFPWVQILEPDASGTLKPYISLGYELFTWKNRVRNKIVNVIDNATFYLGNHKVMAGVNFEHQYALNTYIRNGTGAYQYSSIDDFINGAAPRSVALDWGYNGNEEPTSRVAFNQLGVYLQDEWNVTNHLKLTGGIRVDRLIFDDDDLMANAALDALDFGGRHVTTGKWPESRFQFSPRLGFVWDVLGDKSLKVRGGTGLFAGRMPLVFFSNMPANSGMIKYRYQSRYGGAYKDAVLNAFAGGMVADRHQMRDIIAANDPNAKLTITPNDGARGSFAAVDPKFKMPQVWKSSIAIDYNVPVSFPLSLTGEFTYTEQLQDVLIQDWDIRDELTTWDRFAGADNRYIYPANHNYNGLEAAVLTNTTKGYGWTANVTVNAEPIKNLRLMGAYTHTVNKIISSLPGSNASSVINAIYSVNGPRFSSLQSSSFVIPDRVIASATYTYHKDHFTLVYEGYRPSGVNYVYDGDLNSDGRMVDLIYIPANDSEIRFASEEDRAAYWKFADQDDYLKHHKGQYAEAFGVHAPWVHKFDFRWAHDFTLKTGNYNHRLQLSADIQNIGNLFSSRWGVVKTNTACANGGQFLRKVRIDPDGVPVFAMNTNTDGTPITKSWDYNHSYGQCWRLQVGVKYFFE